MPISFTLTLIWQNILTFHCSKYPTLFVGKLHPEFCRAKTMCVFVFCILLSLELEIQYGSSRRVGWCGRDLKLNSQYVLCYLRLMNCFSFHKSWVHGIYVRPWVIWLPWNALTLCAMGVQLVGHLNVHIVSISIGAKVKDLEEACGEEINHHVFCSISTQKVWR